MRVRNWLIRGLILAGVAVLAALVWLANSWISPERVREQVILTLSEQLEDVDIHVGSARMRILGGIAVSDLRLTRRGEPPDHPFLVVPHAILYHDKEKLNHGKLVIRKVELDRPAFRIERSTEGKWNVSEVIKPSPADNPIPTFVIKNGTVTVIDRTPGALPPATFTDVQCTLLNDPLPMLTLQTNANAKGYGPLSIRGRLNRINKHLSLSVELSEFPLGAAAIPAAQRFAPELAPHLAKFNANANVKAELAYEPEKNPQWRHDITLDVKGARFEHPDLPWPIEQITATVRSVDGRMKVTNGTAQVGQAKVKLSLETRSEGTPAAKKPVNDDPIHRIEENLQQLDISATDIPLNDGLFERLPKKLKEKRKLFSPTGLVDVGYKFTREGAGWRRELEVQPKQAGMTFDKFRYPVSDIYGSIKHTSTNTEDDQITIDLRGTAAGQPVTVKGQMKGEGPDPAIKLFISGQNIPIDEQLYAAIPSKYVGIVREFRASGRCDFVANITQQAGINLTENEFIITIKDGKLNYTAFPYLLEKIKGRLIVRTMSTDPTRLVRPGLPPSALPDRNEIVFDGFTANHADATVWMHGARRLAPDGRNHLLALHVGGSKVPLDAELKSALAVAKVDDLWSTLSPRGKVTFNADMEILDRAPPVHRPNFDPPLDPANDIKLVLEFSGPTVKPTFFPYEFTDLAGRLGYKNNQLILAQITARHGPLSHVKLNSAELRFYPNGIIWADLHDIEMKQLIPDAAFRKALPGKLGHAIEELQLQGGANLLMKQLTILTPPENKELASGKLAVTGGTDGEPAFPNKQRQRDNQSSTSKLLTRQDPIVYWDGELTLFGASLNTGVPWEDAFGKVACVGRYEGTHVGAIDGTVWLDRGIVSRMPVTAAKCKVFAAPQLPDPARPSQFLPTMLQFRNISGDLFHGTLNGEARVLLSDAIRYEVLLTVAETQLEDVARHYKLGIDADLKGIAQAKILIYNKLDPKTGQLTVEGSGNIDIPSGRMYNLPILLELVKVFKFEAPTKTAFEQAHAVFRIQGNRIKVDQLDLIGKVVCVGGSGELDSSGDYVKFEFYTVWSQLLKQMINTPVGNLTAFLSKNLFTIKLVRENGELKYKPAPVPLITEPSKAVLDRLKRAGGKVFGK